MFVIEARTNPGSVDTHVNEPLAAGGVECRMETAADARWARKLARRRGALLSIREVPARPADVDWDLLVCRSIGGA